MLSYLDGNSFVFAFGAFSVHNTIARLCIVKRDLRQESVSVSLFIESSFYFQWRGRYFLLCGAGEIFSKGSSNISFFKVDFVWEVSEEDVIWDVFQHSTVEDEVSFL